MPLVIALWVRCCSTSIRLMRRLPSFAAPRNLHRKIPAPMRHWRKPCQPRDWTPKQNKSGKNRKLRILKSILKTIAHLAAAVAMLLAPAFAASAKPPANVILITIDTVRADHLGCYGYKE